MAVSSDACRSDASRNDGNRGRNASPAHKSRHATSPVHHVTRAHATRDYSLSHSLSLSLFIPPPGRVSLPIISLFPPGAGRRASVFPIKTRRGDVAAATATASLSYCAWSRGTQHRVLSGQQQSRHADNVIPVACWTHAANGKTCRATVLTLAPDVLMSRWLLARSGYHSRSNLPKRIEG